jgi:general secretion pathway protein A
MYESYWQLERKPFENFSDPEFYFPGESHQAALLKLRYAIESRRGGALLAGASGLGKTLIVNMLQSVVGESFGPFVHLVFPQMPADQLMAYLATELVQSGEAVMNTNLHATLPESIHCIQRFLEHNTEQGRHAVVVFDEAHLIDDSRTLETVRLLTNFESAGRPGLTILLAAQPAILPVLDRMPQLEERLGVKCLLRAFTEEETGQYVGHRLSVSGAATSMFEPAALATLHQLTHGIPRQINRLCDLALLIGYAEERSTITGEQIEAVCEELVAVVPE